MCDVAENTSAN